MRARCTTRSYGPIVNSDRQLAEAVQSERGGTGFIIYPINRYTRISAFGGLMHLSESYTNQGLQDASIQYQIQSGSPIFRNGNLLPLGLTFIQTTALFREFGPVAGRQIEMSYSASPKIGANWISRQTFMADVRHYTRLAANGVLAFRFKGQKSWGAQPDFMYFGGNMELRGYDYLEFIGHKAFFANAELRFPMIEAMLTPLGVMGGLRGVLFGGIGMAGFNDQPVQLFTTKAESSAPVFGYRPDAAGNANLSTGPCRRSADSD